VRRARGVSEVVVPVDVFVPQGACFSFGSLYRKRIRSGILDNLGLGGGEESRFRSFQVIVGRLRRGRQEDMAVPVHS